MVLVTCSRLLMARYYGYYGPKPPDLPIYWDEILNPPQPGWKLSNLEAAKEILGVWEIEEHWEDLIPVTSQRSKLSLNRKQSFRSFLVFQKEALYRIKYHNLNKRWSMPIAEVPAYAIDGAGTIDTFGWPLNKLERDPKLYRHYFSRGLWKTKKDHLCILFTDTPGGVAKYKKQRPTELPMRPDFGTWITAKRVDPNADDIGVWQINLPLLPAAGEGQQAAETGHARKRLTVPNPNRLPISDPLEVQDWIQVELRKAFPDDMPLEQRPPATGP